MQPDSAEFQELVRASKLPFGPGHALWTYWTVGEGSAKWISSPTPWTTLHALLLKYIGPQAAGLTTNVMLASPEGRALFAAHHQGGERAVTMESGGGGIVAPTNATIVTDHGNITTPDAADLDTAARKYCAEQGWAMADGSYPIRPADNHGISDAGKAIHAVGRGGASGDSIRRHIIGRLHAIGQADMIPDTWSAKGALTGSDSQGGMRSVATGVLDRVQYRFAADLELRAGGDGRTIVGIAVPWNRPTRIDDGLVEEFDPHSLDHQIRAMHRVGYWRDHSVHGGHEIGHIKYARNDSAGLYTESFISPDDPMGDQTLDEIRSGKYPHQSVGFECGPTGSEMRGGVTRRVKATLTELAAVPQGAYGDGAAVTGVRAASECPQCALRAADEAEHRLARLRALAVSLPTL